MTRPPPRSTPGDDAIAAARAGRRGRRGQRHPRPRLLLLAARHRPRVRPVHRCRLPRPGRPRDRASPTTTGMPCSSPTPAPLDGRRRLRPLRRPRRARRRRDRVQPAVDAEAAHPGRDAADLAGRRRHQLRDDAARPAAARLRPRHPVGLGRHAPRPGRREAHHPRRRRARARPRGPAHRRRGGHAAGHRRCHGWRDVRGHRHDRPTSSSRPPTSTRSRWPAPRAGTGSPPRRPSGSSVASTPRSTAAAAQLAVDLLVEHGGGTADAGSPTSTTACRPSRSTFDTTLPTRYIGLDYPRDEVLGDAARHRLRRSRPARAASGTTSACCRRPGGPTSPTGPSWSRRSRACAATTRSRRSCRSPRRPGAGSPTASGSVASVADDVGPPGPRRGAELPVRRAVAVRPARPAPPTTSAATRSRWPTRCPTRRR